MAERREYGRAYPVAKAVIKPAIQALWRINVTGLHRIPSDGAAIFCPNHISFIDSFVLPTVLPRRISYVGKAEYMDSWKTKYLFPNMGMIPIDRTGGSASQAALDAAAGVLNRGEFFAIYPEGTRSRDGCLHKGRTGAVRLALRTGAPVIPVGIIGTDEIQPAGAALPRPFRSCQVNIGEPVDMTRYLDRYDDRMLQRQLTDEIMFEIATLCGRDYVDTYAGSTPQPAPPDAEPVRSSADVLGGNGSAATQPDDALGAADGSREAVPAGLGAGADVASPMEVRASSADVLARWWS